MSGRVVRLVIAVLLLATGIAIGAGPLQHENKARDRELAAARDKVTERDQQIAALRTAGSVGTQYADRTASALVRGVLTGRAVTLVALPGADPAAVAAIRALIVTAGAPVTAQIPVAAALVSPDGRSLVDALTSQMVTQLANQKPPIPVPTAASGYARWGALLARAVGVPFTVQQPRAAYDAPAVSIISGFKTAELVTAPAVTSRARLTLVIGGAASNTDDGKAASAALFAVVRAYAKQTPTVVAGPGSAATADGLIGRLRSGDVPTMSTVDNADTTIGRVAAVLALAARTRGVTGDYGSVGKTDGPVPPLS